MRKQLSSRFRESLRVFPVFFGDLRGPIRESVRTFRGFVTAADFPFEGVLERISTPIRAIETFAAPVFRILKAALPPRLTFP